MLATALYVEIEFDAAPLRVAGVQLRPVQAWSAESAVQHPNGADARWLVNARGSFGDVGPTRMSYRAYFPFTATMVVPMNEWQSAGRVTAYLERADRIPHRSAGETALLDEIPLSVHRVLDLGSGDGRLLELVLRARPHARGVAVDFSPLMLEQLRVRFGSASRADVVDHNLDDPMPFLGTFDMVVSSFAIHHLEHERKRHLYEEIWAVLEPGGVFCNLEHVAPASPYAHEQFLEAMGITAGEEDPSNQLLDVHTQLEWLREIGFVDVDCYWKWRELALLVGRKPA